MTYWPGNPSDPAAGQPGQPAGAATRCSPRQATSRHLLSPATFRCRASTTASRCNTRSSTRTATPSPTCSATIPGGPRRRTRRPCTHRDRASLGQRYLLVFVVEHELPFRPLVVQPVPVLVQHVTVHVVLVPDLRRQLINGVPQCGLLAVPDGSADHRPHAGKCGSSSRRRRSVSRRGNVRWPYGCLR